MNGRCTLVNTVLFKSEKQKLPRTLQYLQPNPLNGIRYTAALSKLNILLVNNEK